ncbi:MAG: rod shape-determining protein MreC [Bacteroidetes bacterium]|nr:MAG: rod shape-determining protein MreC [Bacteroidota bacterium]TNF00754.1 MAG: rod shape-determining protein MreC [Bacteroidota bacterium]
MRNFLAFIRRFRILLVFAFLQAIALSTYFTFKEFPRSQYLTTASQINGQIMVARNELTKHFNLDQNNKALQRENIKLRNKLPQSHIRMENGAVKINDTLFHQQYMYIPATVIKSSHTKRNNYFTLNVGKAQGVKRGMGVFSDKGIIGVIHYSSEHFSVVKSCLTENINIDVMIEGSGQFGLLKWNGHDARKGTMWGVSNDSDVKLWSKVVTRGGGGIFPRGLTVGKVSAKKPVEGEPLWDIEVLYSEDYRSVQRVYVIKNLLKEEQEALEANIPPDPVE